MERIRIQDARIEINSAEECQQVYDNQRAKLEKAFDDLETIIDAAQRNGWQIHLGYDNDLP